MITISMGAGRFCECGALLTYSPDARRQWSVKPPKDPGGPRNLSNTDHSRERRVRGRTCRCDCGRRYDRAELERGP